MRMHSDPTTEVVVSTAAELVASLYVRAHVDRGDFEQLAAQPPMAESGSDLLQTYFGADFAPGMSLIALAVQLGWTTARELVDGVRAMPSHGVVAALLAGTTLERNEVDDTARQVAEALAADGSNAPVVRRIARRNAYDRRDVEHLLQDPARTSTELVRLLRDALPIDDEPAAAGLRHRAAEVEALIEESGRERALLALTGGWTLNGAEQRLVLVPTATLGPLVITRLLPDDRILVAFGPTRRRDHGPTESVAVARALANDQRIAILQQVRLRPTSGQALAKTLGLTQATVHYHTALLRSCGLITSTRSAHSVLHALDTDELRRSLDGLGRLVLGSAERAEGL